MKYLTSAVVLIALFGAQSESVNAIKLNSHDDNNDLIKSLTEDIQNEQNKQDEQDQIAAAQKEVLKQAEADKKETKKEEKTAKKDAKKDSKKEEKGKAAPAKKGDKKKAETKPVKKETKKEDEDIPMDAAAIKAYSSVIADAAEDSEPQTPVTYKAVIPEETTRKEHNDMNPDPMGSMIQNEISSIKDASIKAAKESSD